MKSGVILLVVLTSLSYVLRANENIPNRAVMIGGDENSDACGTLAKVVANSSIYTLKKGKLDKHPMEKSATVLICEETEHHFGVVVKEKAKDCGVSRAIEERKTYPGPCKSGWIEKKSVKLQAG